MAGKFHAALSFSNLVIFPRYCRFYQRGRLVPQRGGLVPQRGGLVAQRGCLVAQRGGLVAYDRPLKKWMLGDLKRSTDHSSSGGKFTKLSEPANFAGTLS